MNEHSIKLSGKFSISEALEIDTNYSMLLDADIVSITKRSQEDGSYEIIYTAKPITGTIQTKGDKVIKFEKKSSQSAKLRSHLMIIAKERGLDEQEFYEDTMVKIRHNLFQILDNLSSLSDNLYVTW